MDLHSVPTPSMNWTSSNLPEAWRKFQEHCDLIFNGPLQEKEESVKITYLLLWMGEQGRDIYGTLGLSAEQRKKLDTIYQAVKHHLQPKVNHIFSRYKFNNEIQNEQSFEQFLTKLRLLAVDCNFTDKDEMIRDRLVFGVKSQKIREKLINEGDKLTLDRAIQICQSFEYAQEQLREMNQAASSVNAVQRRGSNPQQRKKNTGHNSSGQSGHNTSDQGKNGASKRTQTGADGSVHQDKRNCQKCGKPHDKAQLCRAKGKQCFKCKRWNHFVFMCKSSVNEIQSEDLENSNRDIIFIDSVESTVTNGQVFADFEVGPSKTQVKFKIDTGSQVNILPYRVFQSLRVQSVLEKSRRKLSAYNGNELDLKGCITLRSNHSGTGQIRNVQYHVVDTRSTPLLGLQSCIDFGLIEFTYSVV